MKTDSKEVLVTVVLELTIEELHMLRVFARGEWNREPKGSKADAAQRFIEGTNHYPNPGYHPEKTFL